MSLSELAGIINGHPTSPGFDIYEGSDFNAPARPHTVWHDTLRRVIDVGLRHEISWEDVDKLKTESKRTFTELGVDDELLHRAFDAEHTDWILWNGFSPPEVLAVEALIHGRDKPRAVIFKDSPATRIPKLLANPAKQSGIDHLFGHLVHFHMGGDGQDEYLATRFQSLAIRQRIKEGKWGQALYAPLMAIGLTRHKDIRIVNHLMDAETVARFPVDAFSDEPVPELSKWAVDHTVVPMKYEGGIVEKRSRFIRVIGGRVPDIQPWSRSGSFYGLEELHEHLDEIGFSMQNEPQYDTYPYDNASCMLLVVEKRGHPDNDDVERLKLLEKFLNGWRKNVDSSPPSPEPFPLTQTLFKGRVWH